LPGGIEGTLHLLQKDTLFIYGKLIGFPDEKMRGIHAHVTGDMANKCNNTLAHYNPTNATHGDLADKERHFADWGNVPTQQGESVIRIKDPIAKLTGNHSVSNKLSTGTPQIRIKDPIAKLMGNITAINEFCTGAVK